jgi:hypothetical protein
VRPTAALSFSKVFLFAVLGTCVFACLATRASADDGEGIPPSILSESVSGVTVSNALLEAEIIPGDLTGEEWEGSGGAWYQFQLALDPSEFWPEVTCPEQHPESVIQCLGPWAVIDGPPPQASIERRPGDLPTDDLAGSFEVKSVSLDLESAGVTLLPSTTYHYRVIAAQDTAGIDTIEWATPPVYGPDQTFTTPPLFSGTAEPDPPIPTTGAAGVAASDTRPRAKRCQGKRKVSFRRLSIQCRRAAFRPRPQ